MPIQENKENNYEINEIKNKNKIINIKNCIINIKNCINFRKSPLDDVIFGIGDSGCIDLTF